MQIQWYPGHMTKAKRMLEDNIKVIDVAVVLLDARIPRSSWNPDMAKMLGGKSCIIVLNKVDLADPAVTTRWKSHFSERGFDVIGVTSTRKGERARVLKSIEKAALFRVEAMKKRGVKKVVRVMVAGIPNVGKSTFINMIAGQAMAKSEDRPGVTRGRQWIKISPYLELMDTPGLLWPKFEDDRTGMNLAYCGSVRDDIMDMEKLCERLLERLRELAPEALLARYKLESLAEDGEGMLRDIAKRRGFIIKGGEPDIERGVRTVIDEFRGGRIGAISLETPEDDL